jgi:hypothetical protein
MTDEDLNKLRSASDAATPGPWFLAYATVHDMPRTREHMRIEQTIPNDAPDEAYDILPDTDVCHVPVVAGDTPTAQGARDAEFIAAARSAVPALLDEIERLRSRPWERLRDLGYEVDETGVRRGRVMEREVVALRSALAEAIAIFDGTWCPEHGHAPRPVWFDRIDDLRKLVRP